MVQKTAKKKATKKRVAKQAASQKEDCEPCEQNDMILKAVFIVLGIAIVVAAYYVGYAVGSDGSAPGGMRDSDIVVGDGVVVITEFSDFECPFCERFYSDAYKQIKDAYGDKVVFDYKHFPLGFHPNAQKAAEASECARDQDNFWAYHDRLFDTQQLDNTALKKHAADLGLNSAEFAACLDGGDKAQLVAQDMRDAQSAGVSGTPSFLINGELVVGAQPFSVFKQKIDAALSGAAPAAPAAPSAPTPAAVVDVSIDDDAIWGDVNAPVTVIEFSDYECPFCGRHNTQTVPLIKQNFIDTGKVRYVLRDFPLSIHQNAQKASEAAECAGEQGKYWEMHDKLFENQQALANAQLKQYAGAIGLDQSAFDTCLDSGAQAAEVQKDFADGQAAGVRGTPAVFVNGKLISGAQPYSVFEAAINEALAE